MKKIIKRGFSAYTVLELLALTNRVIKNLTNNTDFLSIQSLIAALQLAGDDLKNANSDAQNGGAQQIQIVSDKRVALTEQLDAMAGNVETACNGDRVKALGSGFDLVKESAVKKVMPNQVINVEAKTNLTPSIIDVSWAEEPNRILYRVEKAAITNGSASPFSTAGYTTRLKFQAKGLTAGVNYQFRIIAINNLGESASSDIATAMSL